ncbi:MAG: hypothetical protein VKJ46_00775 [Leptolyngbyaceae bacterium]|nr:hypothetical protein [Leptolyngbyaceae bacterium]
MIQLWLDRLGDWNPQLFREVKGRLKKRNLVVATAVSLMGQVLMLLYFGGRLPGELVTVSRYCTGTAEYSDSFNCLKDAAGNVLINWQLWHLDVFICLSVVSIFALVVGGVHLLVSDLEQEDRRGTLNFIRLTPQSSQSILLGKLLGVPTLLYLAAAFAIPLHWGTGVSAHIPSHLILSFYGVLAISCGFFYSVALLYGIASNWLGGFQAWLGSGGILLFLSAVGAKAIYSQPLDWLNLFSPATILPYLVPDNLLENTRILGSNASYLLGNLQELHWLNLPVGAHGISTVGLMLVNYGFWMAWLWQSLKRCFRNPSNTLLTKQQSYGLVACFEVLILGFAAARASLSTNLGQLLFLNLSLFLVLIAALSPHRQVLQDWARYRREKSINGKRQGYQSLVQDLIWAEKSPALMAIAINLLIAATLLTLWIASTNFDQKPEAIASILLSLGMILVYGAIAQVLLFMKTQKRVLWAFGSVGSIVVLPVLVLSVLSLRPEIFPGLWLFSAVPWAALDYISAMSAFLGFLGQISMVSLLSFQLTRQLRKSGESASKTLMAGRPALRA